MQRSKSYWQISMQFALIFGALACTESYITQYMLGNGLSGAQMGTLKAVSAAVGLILGPLLLRLADSTGRHRVFLAIFVLIHAVAVVTLGFVVSVWMLAASWLVYGFAFGQQMSLRDRLTLHWLKEQGSESYGSIRLWGSIGYSIVAFVSGLIAARMGVQVVFVISGVLVLLALPTLRSFASRVPTKPKEARRGAISRQMVLILIVAFIWSLGFSCVWGWELQFLEAELGGDTTHVGLYMALIAIFEVPVMLYSDKMMQRRGAGFAWAMSLIGTGIGWALLANAASPLQMVLLAIPMGLVQGVLWTAPIVFVGQVSPAEHTGFNLALIAAVSGVAQIIGGQAAGLFYDGFGVRMLIVIGGAGAIAAGLLLSLGMPYLRKYEAKLKSVA